MGYVYLVKNKTTGLKYIGCKYAKNRCNPKHFFIDYFTGSKCVKLLIEMYGAKDFHHKILYQNDDYYAVLKEERRLIEKILHRDDYINLHPNFLIDDKELSDKIIENQRKVARLMGLYCVVMKIGFFGYSKEKRKEISSKGGKKAAIINKKRGTGIFNPELRKRQHKTLKEKQVSAYYDPALRSEISSKGGKKSVYTIEYYMNAGMSEEEAKKALSQFQSELGKRGGPKNKGFRWYNDGINSYKYTMKMQKEKSFDKFISETNYIPGFIKKNEKRIWVNDGTVNRLVLEEELEILNLKRGRLGDRAKYGNKNKKNK